MGVLLLIHAVAWAAMSSAGAAPAGEPPFDGAAPLHPKSSPDDEQVDDEPAPSSLPVDGAEPLAKPAPSPDTHGLPDDGAAPFVDVPSKADSPGKLEVRRPFGAPAKKKRPLPPREAIMTRVDLMTGPIWRTRPVDASIAMSVESGQAHGFSGAFSLGVMPATDRGVVDAVDVPMGVGAIARGRLRRRPMYASVGLMVGMLIHHARTADAGVVRRVDPDFRLPIRFAWTIASVGLSVAIEQGFSVRDRSYARRGAIVWARDAYRVGLSIGLHWDIVHKSAKARPRRGRS